MTGNIRYVGKESILSRSHSILPSGKIMEVIWKDTVINNIISRIPLEERGGYGILRKD